jgi:Concanavalin A-like lectin/glucanases superfamily
VTGRPAKLRLAATVTAVAALVTAGCGGEGATTRRAPVPERSSTAAVGHPDADLWLSFERTTMAYDGTSAYPDAAGGPYVGDLVSANGGRVTRVGGADGSSAAVAFPRACTSPRGCPRAMVEVTSADGLDPGSAPFEYGATVWLARDQTTTGSNIVQKGRFGTDGGQWKLQVDDTAGKPSCVVRSPEDELVVRSTSTVADSRWHHVVCRRDADGLSISVDGTVTRRAGRTGSVSNPWPVRVGSPGVGDHDDQYHGRVDDVFLRILDDG